MQQKCTFASKFLLLPKASYMIYHKEDRLTFQQSLNCFEWFVKQLFIIIYFDIWSSYVILYFYFDLSLTNLIGVTHRPEEDQEPNPVAIYTPSNHEINTHCWLYYRLRWIGWRTILFQVFPFLQRIHPQVTWRLLNWCTCMVFSPIQFIALPASVKPVECLKVQRNKE